ncbi:hypothetical protein G7B40_009145 [Aetokthonos hydrillicola Thurmond2011]|jgi:hypothetical protein|uniref:Uncharacterized protein n=1 Tax=Aetokthonos hydrillicola Thurmond2011 TaxID=2712845 RepID=A0AAP5I7M0_9CYAN|nr:hypothetical protein [Aetokthonos hydrillicola Thurmond2011]
MCIRTKRLFLAQFLSLVKGDVYDGLRLRIKTQCLKVRFTEHVYVALYVKYKYLTGALGDIYFVNEVI